MDNTPIPPPPAVDPTPRPGNYLPLAIIATLCCCPPTGVVAIVYGSRVDPLYNGGQVQEAQNASKKSLIWSVVSIVLMLVLVLLYSAISAAAYPVIQAEMEKQMKSHPALYTELMEQEE